MTHIQTPLPPTRTHTRTHTDSIRRPPGLDAARRSPGRSHRRPHRLRRRARAGGRRARWGGVGGADGGLVPCTVRRRIGGLRCCAARYVASPGLSRPLRTACIFLFSCRACPRAHTHTPNHPLPPQTHTGTWRRCSSCTTPTRKSSTRGAPASCGSWSRSFCCSAQTHASAAVSPCTGQTSWLPVGVGCVARPVQRALWPNDETPLT